MTIRHLTIFSEVCRNGSITKAADSLNMSQPAVSTAIRELEAYYQTRLFERMNRRLYITEAGQYLLHHADGVLARLAEAKEFLSDIGSATQIRVGSNVSFGQSHLADLITEFKRQHPEIPVQIVIQNSGNVEELLMRNQLDFAIADDLSDSDYFHHRLLLSEDMVAACSPDCAFLRDLHITGQFSMTAVRRQSSGTAAPGQFSMAAVPGYAKAEAPAPAAGAADTAPQDSVIYRLTAEELSSIPLLLREKGSGSRTTADNLLRTCHTHAKAAVESTSTQALIAFALRGHGLVFLPRTLLLPYLENRQLAEVVIDGISLKRSYYLVYHKSKFLTQSMRLFLAHISAYLYKSN